MTYAASTAERSFWVVVADESRAIIYTRETRRAPMQELFSLENEAARVKTAELLSDRGGRSFDSSGKGRHTMAKEKSGPKRHLAEAFAKQIAERVGKASHVGSCRDYFVIAAPRFLGLLRDALATTPAPDPLQTVAKEVVGKDTALLQKLLDK
jgi:protein required for attachment to host cells